MAAISNYTLSGNFDIVSFLLYGFVQESLKEDAKTKMVALGHMQPDKTYDEQIEKVQPKETQERFKNLVLFKERDIHTVFFNAATVVAITSIAFGILGICGLAATCFFTLTSLIVREIAARALTLAEIPPETLALAALEMMSHPHSSFTEYVQIIVSKAPKKTPSDSALKTLNLSALETWELDHNIQLTPEQKEQYIQRRPNYYTLNWGPVEFVVLKNESVSLDLLWDHTFHPEQFQVV